MTDSVDNRDDAVQRLRGLAGDEAEPIVSWIDERERVIRKKDVDFATIVEASSQIAAKSLDLGKIEGYSMTMLMGQFGFLRTFLMRPPEFSDTRITVLGKSKRLPQVSFDADGPIGDHLKRAEGPLDIGPLVAEFAFFEPLVSVGVDVVLPLVIRDRIRGDSLKGCICVGQRIGARLLTLEERELLGLLANLIAVSVHNAQLYHESIVDSLTQVYGRGHFDVRLRDELARVARKLHALKAEKGEKAVAGGACSVSLVLLDIDHFKQVNDGPGGHQTGDLVLQHVARFLSDNVRQVDVVARYGGEEFVLILPEATKSDAMVLTERLRIGLHQQKVVGAAPDQIIQVTGSFGVATFPEDARSERDLVARADKAMYRAKGEGRNRVCGASPDDSDDVGRPEDDSAGVGPSADGTPDDDPHNDAVGRGTDDGT